MTYKRSCHRIDFDARLDFLLKKSKRASRLRASDSEIRDMVFQCAIFQTSAAIETYLKLMIEGWIFKIKLNSRGRMLPESARAYVAAQRLSNSFAKFHFDGDEGALTERLKGQNDLWEMLIGCDDIPSLFSYGTLHQKAAYPSKANIKKLFARIGIKDVISAINSKLKRDSDIMIESLQSVRTALAHSSPPSITLADVEARLADAKALVGAIDRIFYSHVKTHGGGDCWP